MRWFNRLGYEIDILALKLMAHVISTTSLHLLISRMGIIIIFITEGGSHYGKQCGDSLKKLQIELPYDPAIPLLGIHTEELRIERDTCIPMFISGRS